MAPKHCLSSRCCGSSTGRVLKHRFAEAIWETAGRRGRETNTFGVTAPPTLWDKCKSSSGSQKSMDSPNAVPWKSSAQTSPAQTSKTLQAERLLWACTFSPPTRVFQSAPSSPAPRFFSLLFFQKQSPNRKGRLVIVQKQRDQRAAFCRLLAPLQYDQNASA